ncbi:hypothetical protein DFQ28_005946 [Apophysomyces sp. BC1034]|nr:hypothetical protein DFQ30_006257 [Apophysomyces sp. BC1015]KAG0171285.1 hypothetical protein DFQ29_008912 [Apophysomyces sp. BC1021]KAG0187704.1 hypothetical protein DFQ28_005946 [Apophysomyces sp. BC1034]
MKLTDNGEEATKEPAVQIEKEKKRSLSRGSIFTSQIDPLQTTSKRLDNGLSFGKTIEPPTLCPIDMKFSEEEIWIRLQIREFMFRFGEHFQFQPRIIASTQNVQGDWRMKRITAYVVWKALVILDASLYEMVPAEERPKSNLPGQSYLTRTNHLPLMANYILNQWMEEKGLGDPELEENERRDAFFLVFCQEGMTARRWQDIAELLAAAECTDLPVPTIRNGDPENAIVEQIQKFRKQSRTSCSLTAADELRMIQMLLDVLLFDTTTRRKMLDSTKELKEREVALKKERKTYQMDYMAQKTQRNSLTIRVEQLTAVGKQDKKVIVEAELEALDVKIRDERLEIEKKEMDLIIAKLKTEMRLRTPCVDAKGNEYWFFNDLLTSQLGHATDVRNNECYWSYGVIVIGPGFSGGTERRWWHIDGIQNMLQLEKWLMHDWTCNDKITRDALIVQLTSRAQYLRLLENVVYGEGHFSK